MKNTDATPNKVIGGVATSILADLTDYPTLPQGNFYGRRFDIKMAAKDDKAFKKQFV